VSSTKAPRGDLDVTLSWPGAGGESERPRPAAPAPNGSRSTGNHPGPGGDEVLAALVAEVRSMREELRQLSDAVRSAASLAANGTEKPEKAATAARRTTRSRPPSA